MIIVVGISGNPFSFLTCIGDVRVSNSWCSGGSGDSRIDGARVDGRVSGRGIAEGLISCGYFEF